MTKARLIYLVLVLSSLVAVLLANLRILGMSDGGGP